MDLVSSEIPVLNVHRWCPFAVYALGRRGEGAFWGSFYKGTNPIHEGSCSHVLITSPSLYLLYVTSGVGFQHRNSDHTAAQLFSHYFSPIGVS